MFLKKVSFRSADLMKIRASYCQLLVVLAVLKTGWLYAQARVPSPRKTATQETMDRDRSVDEYQRAVGSPLPATIIGGTDLTAGKDRPPLMQALFETDPQAEAPRQKALAADNEVLDRLHLDGFVDPAPQMPPPDQTIPQDGNLSEGPHSDTGWVNMIGVPAVVVPGGFHRRRSPVRLRAFGSAVERRRPAQLGVRV
jgi:hypothetical protein